MLPVVIPTRTLGSAPARALCIEGYEVTEVVMEDPQHYGRLIAGQWKTGLGFVLVEDDVVPWPGAVQAMLDCEHDWCAYEFPRTHPRYEPRAGWVLGLGCVRFSHALVRRYSLEDRLDGSQRWDDVDGAVIGMLHTANEVCHVHTPPVAHIKAHVMLHRRGDMPA